jgi:alanine-glyoxylate transaminase/serine-glyoxylate transaminase/serine-pyruvate transaminase
VYLFASNGHGMWESAAANLASAQHTLLLAGSGHFSDQWALQIEGLGIALQRTPYQEGHPFDVAAIEQALREDTSHRISAVLVVHTDTASSTTSDIPALRRAIDAAKHPALFVVDVVASLGAIPFYMDQWGVNAVMGASQKGLMCPPGVGFCAADERAMQVCANNPAPRFYWDWIRRRKGPSYSRFCGTAPQNLLFGLEAAFGLIEQEGVAQVHARHQRLAGAVRAAVQSWSEAGQVQFLCQVPEARSASVTAVVVAKGIDPELIRSTAREKFQVLIAGGLGPFAGRVFRIGHLGDLNPAMILGCLAGVEAAMQSLGVNVGSTGVRSAVEYLAKT